MIKVKNIKLLGILLAVLVIFLGVRPLFTQTITNDSIASAIILVLIGIVGIVVAFILSYVFTQKIRLRISELNYATSQTSAGNFDVHIDATGKDEIGNLGRAFNKMLEELKKNQKAKN